MMMDKISMQREHSRLHKLILFISVNGMEWKYNSTSARNDRCEDAAIPPPTTTKTTTVGCCSLRLLLSLKFCIYHRFQNLKIQTKSSAH